MAIPDSQDILRCKQLDGTRLIYCLVAGIGVEAVAVLARYGIVALVGRLLVLVETGCTRTFYSDLPRTI